MAIDLQSLINSQLGFRAVSFLGRTTPPVIGYKVADLVAEWLATQRNSDVIQAIRTNQWVVRGAGPGKETLDQAVVDTLKSIAHSLYSLYHYIDKPEAIQPMVDLDPTARELVQRPEFGDRGLMLVGLHLSSFDLILQSMCMQGFKAFVLTIPDPKNGRQLEYEMRKRTGMNLVPASVSAMRQAVNHLERGGVVLTGIDRPVLNANTRPRFFGKSACLPVHHISLARRAGVPVVIVSARRGTDGCYHVRTSEPIEMNAYADHETDILQNAERVLQEAEKYISQAPEQWSISLPVWPDLKGYVPR